MDKNDRKWFMTKVQRAIRAYRLIEPQDSILVGLSGGKDSLSLLFILNALRQYKCFSFDLAAACVDMGWPHQTSAALEEFCLKLEIPFKIIPTDLAQQAMTQKHPCLYCSTMRRGILVDAAQQMGATKIALGHSRSDFVETLLLNLLEGGRYEVFAPRIDYPEKQLAVIRPLVYLDSQTTAAICRKYQLPICANPCPLTRSSRRAYIRGMIAQLKGFYPDAEERLLHSLEHAAKAASWPEVQER